MFLITLFLGAFFLPKTGALQCYECPLDTSGTCNQQIKECPSQNYQCLASRTVTYQGGNKMLDIKMKGCGMPKDCVEGSINFGVVKSISMTSCCTTKLCNDRFQDYKSSPNGKKCFSCEGEDCSQTVNCEGEENHCIKVTGNAAGVSATMKGCASKAMCTDQVKSLLDTLYSGVQFSCCQGDYCNSASIASPALLLLLVPLFFSVIFC